MRTAVVGGGAARRYLPSLRAADLVRHPAGGRAQALDTRGNLVDDFAEHIVARSVVPA